jgi:hypothetical protein
MISQEPRVWGASAWKYLDAVAASFPPGWKGEEVEKELHDRIMGFWTYLYLPCETCMQHYLDYLSLRPLDKALVTHAAFQQWYQDLKVHIAVQKQSSAVQQANESSTMAASVPIHPMGASLAAAQRPPPPVVMPRAIGIPAAPQLPIVSGLSTHETVALASPSVVVSPPPAAAAPRAKAAAHAQFRSRFMKDRLRNRVTGAVLVRTSASRPSSSSMETKDPNHGARGCSSCSAATRAIQPRLG